MIKSIKNIRTIYCPENEDTCLGCFLFLLLIIGGILLGVWILQLLWNWLVPLFWAAAPILTYWQSFGICTILSVIGYASMNYKNNI